MEIWNMVGFIDHTNEHLIGTNKGIIKCRAIRRQDETSQFDINIINDINGTPWRPVLGRDGLKIPTNIEEDGTTVDENGDMEGHVEEDETKNEERFHMKPDMSQDESTPSTITE